MHLEDKRDEQLRQALVAIKTLQARLQEQGPAVGRPEPVAIVGMDCRFPGANSPAEFWQMLLRGENQVGTVPASRWDATDLYDPNPEQPGKMYTQAAGTIADIEAFDNEFFGISPHEALALDPQQRLLLEVCWHALEEAQLAPIRLAQTRTGVFVAISNNDYGQRRLRGSVPEQVEAYDFTGNIFSTAAGRISYALDLMGPNLVVDTACSSSLVAVHLACQSLLSGESDLALAGGVNLILDPAIHIALSKVKALSPDGACKVFDAEANGYVRSEGCGVVVLKRLADAQRDGDPVLAVIRASGVNQDGRSNGLTAPNGQAQEQLLRETLRRAQLVPAEVAFIEAHGTGTALGDPIEVEAIKRVYASERPHGPLLLGAVKSTIGHLEAAAGLAGLLKVVLSLRHRLLPGNLHFRTPNPLIAWDETIAVPQMPTPLAATGRLAAGISSFGISGTNAHLLVQAAPEVAGGTPSAPVAAVLLPVSAKSAEALRGLLAAYATGLPGALADAELADIAAVAARGRNHFTHRKALVVSSKAGLAQQLAAALSDGAAEAQTGGIAKAHRPGEPLRVAFLCSGQGAQYAGMGAELHATEPAFRAAWAACEEILVGQLSQPLKSIVFENDKADVLNQTAWTQPALFVLEYCLAQLWLSWGIRPAVLGGHSLGEYVAACLAGVFSLPEALGLIVRRAALMQAVTESGAMYSVFASEAEVQAYLAGSEAVVSIAATNAAQHTVVSGAAGPLAALMARMAADGLKSKALHVSHAFHSPLMVPVVTGFRQALAAVAFQPARLPLLSNLSGGLAGAEISTPDYWVAHLLAPVRSHENMVALAGLDCTAVLELGPQPVLLAMSADALPTDWLRVGSLRRGNPNRLTMLRGLGALYEAGAEINWAAVAGAAPARPVPLPRYPFARHRFWLENARPAAAALPAATLTGSSPLAGRRLALPGSPEVRFSLTLSSQHPVSLQGHRVFDEVVLPGAAYIELLLQAAKDLGLPLPLRLADVRLTAALTLRAEPSEIQVVMRPVAGPEAQPDRYRCEIFSQVAGAAGWTSHATAELGGEAVAPAPPVLTDVANELAVNDFYVGCEAIGIRYEGLYRSLVTASRWAKGAVGQVKPAPEYHAELAGAQLHPALLDCAFQAFGTVLLRELPGKTFLPVGIEELVLSQAGATALHCLVQCQSLTAAQPTAQADLWLSDGQQRPVAFVRGLKLLEVSQEQLRAADPEVYRRWLYTVEWLAQPLLAQPTAAAAAMPAPAALHQAIAEQLAPAVAQAHDGGYAAVLTGLNQLSVAYICEAMTELGLSAAAPGPWPLVGLPERLGVVPRHECLLHRCLAILAEKDLIVLTDSELHWLPGHWPTAAQALAQLPAGAETALLSSCGPHLAAVLRGHTDPLHLLFPNGDLSAVARLYRESPGFGLMQGALRSAARQLARSLSDDGSVAPLRILEIGAGTGSSTRELLPELRGLTYEYVFTDVSRLFLSQAAEELAEFANLRFATLDIEQDPVSQGFKLADFDVVVASNVLHATADLAQTFGHVRQLLRPGGLLLLSEGTEQFYWTDLIFGLTEGWWRFTDKQLRPAHPLLSEDGWRGFLQAQQFGAVEAFTPQGPAGETLAGQSLLLARYTPAETLTSQSKPNWLIDLTDNSQAHEWAADLPEFVYGPSLGGITEATPLPQHLALVFGAASGVDPAPEPAAATEAACNQAISAMQRLLRAGCLPTGRLCLLVAGACAAGLPAAALLALRKVVEHEHPELKISYLEVDDWATAPARLRAELASDTTESEVRYRGATRQVARLRTLALPAANAGVGTYQQAATYLITGGLGGLGWVLAKQLAAGGAGRLVLLGRSAPDAATLHEIEGLRRTGTVLEIALADVGDAAQIAAVFSALDRPGRPLRGIIHAAGVVADAALTQQSADSVAAVFRAKVRGSWHLHQLSQGQPLDFFVLFGSSASVLGPAGQANHAAANGFLDQLARHRQQLGLPGLSIAWGPWATTGAAVRRGVVRRIGAAGIDSIGLAAGLRAFEALRAQPQAAVAVVPFRWAELGEPLRLRPLMDEFVAASQHHIALEPNRRPARLREQLQTLAPARRAAVLAEHVHERVKDMLGFGPEKRLDFRQGLFELGMDSLTAIGLKNRLQTDLDCVLGATLLFKFPSVAALAEHLASVHLATEFATELADELTVMPALAAPAPAPSPDLALETAALSDDELAQLVAAEFSKLAL